MWCTLPWNVTSDSSAHQHHQREISMPTCVCVCVCVQVALFRVCAHILPACVKTKQCELNEWDISPWFNSSIHTMCFIQLSKQVPLVKTTHMWQPDNTYNEGARTSSFCFYAWGVRVCASAYVDKNCPQNCRDWYIFLKIRSNENISCRVYSNTITRTHSIPPDICAVTESPTFIGGSVGFGIVFVFFFLFFFNSWDHTRFRSKFKLEPVF